MTQRTLATSFLYGVMALALAASTVSTKAAGFFWLSLLILGMVFGFVRSQQTFTPEEHQPFRALQSIAKGWLFFCLLALGLKAVPMLYWSGPWSERHAEFRLLAGAFGCYLLLRFHRMPLLWREGIGHGLAVACFLSLVLAAAFGSLSAPTYRIAWAGGVSVLTCLVLTWSFMTPTSSWMRAWFLCGLLGVCTVLISGVRGSYQLFLIWPVLAWVLHRQSMESSTSRILRLWPRWSIAVVVAPVFVVAQFLPFAELPVQRLYQVVVELGFAGHSNGLDPNTSNGARILLWKVGIHALQTHWLTGVGFTGAKELIQLAAHQAGSPLVQTLGHFHNDYIHAAVEFGILGFLSFLSYTLGMFWCAFRLRRCGCVVQSHGVFALLVLHSIASLSNVNFAHNYYTTILSMAISLLLWSATLARHAPLMRP